MIKDVSEADVVIVGAGPAGSATALRLAWAGCKVLLVERSMFDKPRIGESLAPAIQPLIAELGLWQNFLELDPLPSYGTRSVWGSAIPQEHSHLLTPWLNGWHINRLAFDRMMASAACKAGAILRVGSMIIPEPVSDHDTGGCIGLNIQVKDQHQSYPVHTKFLIDASGRQATLASRLGAERIVFDRLVAIAAQVDDPDANDHQYTLVETVVNGWWYAAPVSRKNSIVMLMTDGDLMGTRNSELRDQDLRDRWDHALQGSELAADRFRGKNIKWGPKIFSAVSQRVIRGPGDQKPWISVGDACLSVDPISGSGVIRALRTAEAAATTVLAVLEGEMGAIEKFEADRNRECHKYLSELCSYYSMERRWPDSDFWKRRFAALGHYLTEEQLNSA